MTATPAGGRRRWPRVLLAVVVLAAALAALDALWIEPRLLLVRDRVEVDLVPTAGASRQEEPYRIVHLRGRPAARGLDSRPRGGRGSCHI